MAVHRWISTGRALALVGVVAVTVAACGGGSSEQDTAAEQFEDALEDLDEAQPTEDTQFEEEPAPKEPELTPVDLDLPREAVYTHATWTVDEVTYQGVGVDEFGVETSPAAVVGFTVANSGAEAFDIPMAADRLWLLDADDFAIAAEYGSGGDGETLAANGRSSFEAVFPLEDGIEPDDLEDYSFKIGREEQRAGRSSPSRASSRRRTTRWWSSRCRPGSTGWSSATASPPARGRPRCGPSTPRSCSTTARSGPTRAPASW